MNNFSGTLIDGLQTLRESRIENRKMEDVTKIRHVLAADCSPMNVGNDLDSPLLSKSDSDQEHSVLQSSTPTRQVRTYSISFKVRTLKLSLCFPAKCMVWLPVVIGSLQKKPRPHDSTKSIYLPLSKTCNWFFSPWMSHAHFGQKNGQGLQ